MKIFSVYDKKSKSYDVPFLKINANVAQREFHMACQQENTFYYQFPGDYELHELGEFDEQTGAFVIQQSLKTFKHFDSDGIETTTDIMCVDPIVICQASVVKGDNNE